MKQADTFIALQCECPHCGELQEPEWAEESENELSEWSCCKCHEEFTYCHPANNYGLAK